MMNRPHNLPDYRRPPLTEVALSVQFNAIASLLTPQLGLLWADFRDRFPRTEEHPPIVPQIEQFGRGAAPRNVPPIQVTERPETPRCWFLNEAGNELIQVQKDRFIVNWRKNNDTSHYPRYEQLQERFRSDFGIFERFLQRQNLGKPQIHQCEVTYVNHLLSGEGWNEHGQLEQVISLWSGDQSEEFLPDPEEVRFASQYIIPDDQGQPIGRLHINLQPAFLIKEDRPVFILTLVARGKPLGQNVDGAIRFLDLGREWIVRGFTSITTKSMHQIWERLDAR